MKCDGCTLCCYLLDIKWLDAPPNTECRHCDPGVGCKIHSNRPKECRGFNCAYLQGGKSVEQRPDKCHAIFQKITDDLFLATQDPRHEVSEVAKKQAVSFLRQGYSVMFVSSDGKRPQIFLADGHTREEIIEQWRHTVQI